MPTPFASLRDSSGPTAAVEIAATRVSGASLEWRGGQAAVTGPAPPTLAQGALCRVLGRLGHPRRIALVLPDPVAKVSLVTFERVPERAHDLDELVRWQV